MSIVSIAVTQDTTIDSQRVLRFRLTDHLGQTYDKGPVFTVDPEFNLDAHKLLMIAKVEAWLIQNEIDEVLG